MIIANRNRTVAATGARRPIGRLHGIFYSVGKALKTNILAASCGLRLHATFCTCRSRRLAAGRSRLALVTLRRRVQAAAQLPRRKLTTEHYTYLFHNARLSLAKRRVPAQLVVYELHFDSHSPLCFFAVARRAGLLLDNNRRAAVRVMGGGGMVVVVVIVAGVVLLLLLVRLLLLMRLTRMVVIVVVRVALVRLRLRLRVRVRGLELVWLHALVVPVVGVVLRLAGSGRRPLRRLVRAVLMARRLVSVGRRGRERVRLADVLVGARRLLALTADAGAGHLQFRPENAISYDVTLALAHAQLHRALTHT